MTDLRNKKTPLYSGECIDILVARQQRFQIRRPLIKKISGRICGLLGLNGWALCVKFVGKDEIAELNQEFRAKDYATDVLSFPQVEWRKSRTLKSRSKEPSFGSILGDIVICLDIAEQNAKKIGQGIDREVCFLLVHGILHLCGHDHEMENEERLMLDQQRKIMASLEEGKTPLWDNCVRIKVIKKQQGVST